MRGQEGEFAEEAAGRGLWEGGRCIFYLVCNPASEKLLAVFTSMEYIPYNLAGHDSISSAVKWECWTKSLPALKCKGFRFPSEVWSVTRAGFFFPSSVSPGYCSPPAGLGCPRHPAVPLPLSPDSVQLKALIIWQVIAALKIFLSAVFAIFVFVLCCLDFPIRCVKQNKTEQIHINKNPLLSLFIQILTH